MHLSKKTIQEAVWTVSETLKPQYHAIQHHILKGSHVNDDETSWHVMGLSYWVWLIVGTDAVWFNIQKGRGTDKAKNILPDYQGAVGSDSWSPWNHVGKYHQKCHLHYVRDLIDILKENENPRVRTVRQKTAPDTVGIAPDQKRV